MSGNFEVCPVGTAARLAQVEAERDALRDEKYRLRHLLAQARFFVDRAPHGDERDCPVCEFVNRIDGALAEKGGGNG